MKKIFALLLTLALTLTLVGCKEAKGEGVFDHAQYIAAEDSTENMSIEAYIQAKTYMKDGTVNLSERFLDENNSDVVIRDAKMLNVLKKVQSKNFTSFGNTVLPRNPFGIDSDTKLQKEQAKRPFKRRIC